jgi:hypothetical protein
MKENNALTSFVGEGIRKIWYDEQWYFNVSDVIGILTDSKDPKAYWRNLKKRLLQEGNSQSVSNCYGLKFEAVDGKKYLLMRLRKVDEWQEMHGKSLRAT